MTRWYPAALALAASASPRVNCAVPPARAYGRNGSRPDKVSAESGAATRHGIIRSLSPGSGLHTEAPGVSSGVASMWIVSRRHRVTQSLPDTGEDELSAELTAEYWEAHNERIAAVSFRAMARRLPGLIGQAVRLGWEANRRGTTAPPV